MEFLASFVEDLIGVFFTSTHTLKLRQVLSCWKHLLQLLMFVFVGLEFCSYVLEGQSPLFLQHVVFLETATHVSLVLLVMFSDLRFALLEDLDFKATFPWPLLSQVLVKLLNRLVL